MYFQGKVLGYIFRLVGVCVLYILGVIVKTVNPSAKTYSFKAIYNMDFDEENKGDLYLDKFRQRITGFLFFLGLILIYRLFLI
jgi:hypothetical protein